MSDQNPLGIQTQEVAADYAGFVRRARPRWVLLYGNQLNLETARTVRRESPGTRIALRDVADRAGDWYCNPDDVYGSTEWTRFFVNHARAAFAPFAAEGLMDLALLPNEPGVHSVAAMRLLSDLTILCADAFHAEGWRCGGPNFATGNPQIFLPDGSLDPTGGLWAYYWDAVRRLDVLTLHEYDAPTMRSRVGYECLRYRFVRAASPADARRPILMTECGFDFGSLPNDRGGWRERMALSDAVDGLRWYASELARDDYVLGACVFGYGLGGQWASFDWSSDDESRAALEHLISENIAPAPAPLPVPEPIPTPPPAPAPVPVPAPGGTVDIPIALSGTLKAYGAYAFDHAPEDMQADYFRLNVPESTATATSGQAAGEFYFYDGIAPVGGVVVVARRTDEKGEVLLTGPDGKVAFLFGAPSAFTPPAPGPIEVFAADDAVKDDETKKVTWGVKRSASVFVGDAAGTHTLWRVKLQRGASVVPPVPDDGVPDYTGLTPDEAARRWGWARLGRSYNGAAAFQQVAARGRVADAAGIALGYPVTDEARFTAAGVRYAVQGFALGIVLCVEGDWAGARVVGWTV